MPQPPVVFVHGLSTSSAIWSHQLAVLTEAGHPCVAVDLPGHGRRADGRFTLDAALAAIDEGVRGLPAPPLLVGLSLGGYTSLAYAARNPDAVAGVVLSGCSTEIRGWPLRAYSRVSPVVARVLRRARETWHVVTDMLTAMHGHSSLADLRRLPVPLPVWFVNGRWDVLRFGERRLVAARPGARLRVLPRAGHDVNTHAPVAFTRVLLEVVRDLGRVSPTAALAPA
ncbi:MAG: alpha/beta fold hydrolase [Actinomycetales bacterium]|jgi:pimeloyl-ACP methyl ester carboxylesterase|nr:alpha/beta fold hydrolase [Actinomycetales bacterium]